MLSHEASTLTTLVLARHILLAQAAEGCAAYDYLETLHEPPFDRLRPDTEDDAAIHRKYVEIVAELELFVPLLLDLEERIHNAWRRLRFAR